ncbi:MAG: hypothetical protein AAB656_04175 [Patescibacteria group bacterium]
MSQRIVPANQVGIVHLLPLIILALVATVTTGLILVYRGVVKNPIPGIIKIPVEAQVDLVAEYKNPLDKTSQYVNPFSEFKNPFDALK